MIDTLDHFLIGNGTDVNAIENETLEQQTNTPHNDFERFDSSSSRTRRNQLIKNFFEDKIRKAVDKAVLTVKNCMHGAILTAMDKMVTPKVETAVRSVSGLTGHGPISDVQNLDRRDLLGNAGSTPLMSASSRLDLNTSQKRNDEIRNEEDFEDGDFPAFKTSYDERAPTHQTLYKYL